ncbi:bis(5'-nucleosyl)-tetraphosphatase (symmetrical) YqeK [Bariatricus massiliensis]|mgnify:CR=1 FL=1|uniref:bis(5'-nucleosyl)-tetraphosphatase (symmetrical) n=1 Tax=Bariatricus massiliensis TaxID=1745713 RepID=A0ABS8DCJ2_9FIRM|nr:bis(5'-nucleosyl)-tetraphosphatase (symmetrical) YqeK [Bariatricus massiliensis]MCB7303341.1 bis(5'-nucleosyl)-tetraphosphatase (symmetrical) YqeK [Bariatricus massiliensis]MCB7373473.1 bis(5'-nucleosyl)-tetraphosphatase (symmetrical) YqeK [Bariatricus massiliensis]MCB7386143.1 bis(5'-nucleosyl)-tetraphosphatase (symmetrical) YqeK [Bariatricus massiliensis]MCB7410305.1 bis(5'-nucleosyl)-tetraphosphatase (symmetrical) YqeK [Bariatricus massiliensis]MCQ5252411.1 bis(5'-nucleosyl)-tetraphospha
MTEAINKMRKKVKRYLDSERYEHTLGVMYTAGCLAMKYGEDMERAMTAGVLHDCAKCIPNDEKIKLCRKYHLDISEAEMANPGLLHAKLGAFITWKKYHVEDREIICAIAAHTTGRPDMSLLDKIIYIADFIEPGRDEAPSLPIVRKLAFTDLDACLLRVLEDSLSYLNTKGAAIDPMTEKTYLYYKNRKGGTV